MYRTTLTFCFLVFSRTIFAQSDAISELDHLLQGVETLSADITQLIIQSDGGVLEESDIRLRVKRPNGFYWETVSPFPELLVTNGKTLWNYQPDLEQVVIEDWNPDQSELAAQLLYGRTEGLVKDYYVVAINSEQSRSFELKPKSADSLYDLITINFVNETLDLIYIQNNSGERTAWQFMDSRINIPMVDDLFEFSPPEGIEIINNSIN